MNFRNDSFIIDAPGKVKPLEGVQLNAVMRNVYGWMTMGLLVTAAIALAVANSGFFPSQGILWLAIFAQLGIVLGLSFAIKRISATAAGMLFFVYSRFDRLHLLNLVPGVLAGLDRSRLPQHGRRLRRHDHRWHDHQNRPDAVTAAIL